MSAQWSISSSFYNEKTQRGFCTGRLVVCKRRSEVSWTGGDDYLDVVTEHGVAKDDTPIIATRVAVEDEYWVARASSRDFDGSSIRLNEFTAGCQVCEPTKLPAPQCSGRSSHREADSPREPPSRIRVITRKETS